MIRVQFQWERVRPKSNYLGWLKTYRIVKRAVKTLTKFANTLETLLLFFSPTLAFNFNLFSKEIYMLVYKYAKILIENTCNFINEFRSCNIKPQWISDWLKPWKPCKPHSALSTWLIISEISSSILSRFPSFKVPGVSFRWNQSVKVTWLPGSLCFLIALTA